MADVKFSELQYSDDTAVAMRALLDKGQNLVYASVKTMNIANGNVGLLVLDGNCTLTISGLANGMYGLLFVTGNGHTLTINGQSVTLNTTGETIVSFSYFFNTLRISAGGASTSGGGLSLLGTPTVTVDSSTSTTITLHWGAVTNATNYIVKASTTNSVGAATQVYSGSSTNTVITGLTNGQLYYIFVIAQGAGYADSNPGTAQRTTGDLSGTQLSTPTLALTVNSSTAITAAWDNVANEEGYTVQIATNSGFTTGVQTYNAAANEVSHQFTGLTPGTLYYGRVKAVGDGIDYSDSAYGSDSDTTSAGGGGGTLEDLIFTDNTGLENTAGVWAGTNLGNYYLSYGLATKSLAAGQDGYIEFQFKLADGFNALLAFNLENVSQSFSTNPANPGSGTNTYEASLHVTNSGSVQAFDNLIDLGSIGTGIGNDTFMRISRTGSVIKAQYRIGSTVTDIRTYNFSSTARLYINAAIFSESGQINKLYYPKGFNLS